MSVSLPLPSAAQVQELDVELAKFGGVDLKSATQVTAYVAMLISALGATNIGRAAGLVANERLISAVVFGLVVVAHILGRYYHHSTVEIANAQVKQALIAQAAAAQIPVVANSQPSAQSVLPVPVPGDFSNTPAASDWTQPQGSAL